jgi:hypothetical protein
MSYRLEKSKFNDINISIDFSDNNKYVEKIDDEIIDAELLFANIEPEDEKICQNNDIEYNDD